LETPDLVRLTLVNNQFLADFEEVLNKPGIGHSVDLRLSISQAVK